MRTPTEIPFPTHQLATDPATSAPDSDRDRDRTRDRDDRAWVIPTVTTVLLVVLVPFAVVCALGAAMATDPCGPGECQALDKWVSVIGSTLFVGLVVTPGAYLASWLVPWKQRWAAARLCLALLALAPPSVVVFLTFTLPQP